MKILKLTISSVDGLSWVQIGTLDPKEIDKFCERFRHEGDFVTLEVLNGKWETFYNEDAFKKLERLKNEE